MVLFPANNPYWIDCSCFSTTRFLLYSYLIIFLAMLHSMSGSIVTMFFLFSWGIMLCWFLQLITWERFYLDLRWLIGNLTLPIKCKHQCVAPVLIFGTYWRLHCNMAVTCIQILLPPPKKEVMFLVRSVCLLVCLFVCLSVRQITRKLVNGFWRNFLEG